MSLHTAINLFLAGCIVWVVLLIVIVLIVDGGTRKPMPKPPVE